MTTLQIAMLSVAVGSLVFIIAASIGFRITRGLSTLAMVMVDETENDSEPAVV